MMQRQIVLDTETTGLSTKNGDRMIEFAAIELINRRATGKELHCYFNIDKQISDEAVRVHGITNVFLQASMPTPLLDFKLFKIDNIMHPVPTPASKKNNFLFLYIFNIGPIK